MLGGVAEELRRQRRSRNFDFHGSPAERIYAGEELRRQRRSRNFDFHGSPAERICAKNLDENASTRFLFMCASLLSLFLWAHAPEAAPRKPLRPPNNEKKRGSRQSPSRANPNILLKIAKKKLQMAGRGGGAETARRSL